MSLAMLEQRLLEPLARFLKRVPDNLSEPPAEDRLVLGGVSWEQYVAFDEERGADNIHPRLYFLNDEVEIMTTSLQHEKLKDWIGRLLVEFCDKDGIDEFTHGHATMQKLGSTAAEPDASWCFGVEKKTPDLVLEIALTSGGLNKLEIYRRFPVPEVWFWRKDRLEIWSLRADETGYDGPARQSLLLPALDVSLLESCIALPTWREARLAFRAGLIPGVGE